MTAFRQKVPRTQSASVAQGNAHLPYAMLQRWLMHIESFVHVAAAGPGTARVEGSANGSIGAGAELAGAPGAAAGAEASPVAQASDPSASSGAATAAKSEACRMSARVRVPFSRRMRQRKLGPFVFSLALLAGVPCLASCTRGEPPQWDAGAGVSLAVAVLPIDAGSASPGAAAPDAAAAVATSGEESGKLGQTRARPEPSGEQFDARVRALFDGIARDDVEHAMPFFFPLTAYAQVKAIANPAADWKARLVGNYARDIHALHAKLGPNAARARFLGIDVPMDRARWVEPGEEYNRIGYFRVYGSKLRGELDGAPVTIDVKSLISWRGEWFIVHLTGVK
ncbi:MAG: hypothetical protein ACLQBL_21390 [Polyangiaceae bacterium]